MHTRENQGRLMIKKMAIKDQGCTSPASKVVTGKNNTT